MVISDLITDQELSDEQVNSEKWCECIDGALTKENYLSCIRDAGFEKIDILEEFAEDEPKTYKEISGSII